MLEEPDGSRQEGEAGPSAHTICEIISKRSRDLNTRPETMKEQEDTGGGSIMTWVSQGYFGYDAKSTGSTDGTRPGGPVNKTSCTTEETVTGEAVDATGDACKPHI